MSAIHLFFPAFALAMLTFFVAFQMSKVRKRARDEGLSTRYFKHNSGAQAPEYMLRVDQHYVNLFELPVLFYVALGFVVILDVNHWLYVMLAWMFVIFRVVHAWVHIRTNRLVSRRRFFVYSFFTVMVMWLLLFVDALRIQFAV